MLNEFCKYFICFMVFSFIGWVYESIFYSVQLRRPVNTGFLKGCICPIYGFGGMLLLPIARMNFDIKTIFFMGMIVCSVLEYFISWLLEYLFDARWWDYSDWPLNLNGRICAVSVFGFGVASLIGTQIIIPGVLDFVSTMGIIKLHLAAVAIAAILGADICYTLKNMNPGEKLPWFVEEHSQMVEKHKNNIGEAIRKIMRK